MFLGGFFIALALRAGLVSTASTLPDSDVDLLMPAMIVGALIGLFGGAWLGWRMLGKGLPAHVSP
jgi:hypothetical protein